MYGAALNLDIVDEGRKRFSETLVTNLPERDNTMELRVEDGGIVTIDSLYVLNPGKFVFLMMRGEGVL